MGVPDTNPYISKYDNLQLTEGEFYAEGFPEDPDDIAASNFYDLALALYTIYYRTGDVAWRTKARTVAQAWRDDPWNTQLEPRNFSSLGLAILALEAGDAEAARIVDEQARKSEYLWPTYGEARETAYSLMAMLAAWVVAGWPASDLSIPPQPDPPSSELFIDKLVVTEDQPVTISWDVTAPTQPQDVILLVPQATGVPDWGYAFYTEGLLTGTKTVTAPLLTTASELYELRYYRADLTVRATGPVVRVVSRYNHRMSAQTMLESILAGQQPDGRWENPAGELVPVPYTLNYMNGLLMEALVLYYRVIGDARILPAVRNCLEWTWTTQWVPSAQAFQYANVDEGTVSTTPYANLNGLLLPAWGYAYAKTGEARYRDRGQQILVGLVDIGGGEILGVKQFAQLFRSSSRWFLP
jgi:hypothetical protein